MSVMEKVDADNARKQLLYCLGDSGTYVLADGSFHAETVNMMSSNVAIVEDVVSSGAGNEVDLEQILVWNPEVIIFAPVAAMMLWQMHLSGRVLKPLPGSNITKRLTGPMAGSLHRLRCSGIWECSGSENCFIPNIQNMICRRK